LSPVLAASQQQRIGLGVVLVLVFGWLVFLITTARRTREPGAELVEAPNRRPYYDDEGLEGTRLTKYLWWAFAMLTISAIGLPVYWLHEPYRQKGAGFDRGAKYFEDTSIKRGEEAFQATPGNPPTPREPHYGCETCHGVEGVGGSALYTLSDPSKPDAPARQVQWTAPPLNTALLRYRPEEIKTIITYGRAGTPMPPWGVLGGGALNDQQIEDLISYIGSIQLNPKTVKAEAVKQYGTDGPKLFDAYCARCHTQGFSYGEPGVQGGGAYGPNLTGGSTVRQFPDIVKHVDWVAATAKFGAGYGVRGISKGVMPHFEDMLMPEQIKAIVDYERGL